MSITTIDLNNDQQILDILQFAINTSNAKKTLTIIADFLSLNDVSQLPNAALMPVFKASLKGMTSESIIEALNNKYSNAQYTLDYIAKQITKKK